jgi:hypothetical protein
VKTLYDATLDPALYEQVRLAYPYLLKPPKGAAR